MKNISTRCACLLIGLLLSSLPQLSALGQDNSGASKKLAMSVNLNSDIFFGFYPSFGGTYQLSDKLDFTFYGILWSGGTGAAWGNWTEFGVGVGFPVGESLYINPQIGLLNGSLTSGLGTPVLGEGFVPNLTAKLNTTALEGEFYLGYYTGLDHGNRNTNNYLHYWLNGGYKISSLLSLGLHYEHLRFTGGKNHNGDAAYDFYVSVGPYIQFAAPQGGFFTRFTSGFDLRSDEQVKKSNYRQPSFFKLSVGYSF
ncbi:MAG: DUF6733 family protein [Cytophagales bacterium]|nr:hypothetical protein [Bernardetiaceae bacterium]MDW8204999.1 DUF6733 family protein [Cytophagales bacterium]